MPFTILRRLDVALEGTKDKALLPLSISSKPGGLCNVSVAIKTIVGEFVSLRKYSYKRDKSDSDKFEPKEWTAK